jgi:type I restriction enzyme S subunit
MHKFRKVKIADIGKVVTGKTPLTNKPYYYGPGYMFVGPVDLHNNYEIRKAEKYITDDGLKSIKGSIIDGRSILVGCIGWDIGNVAMATERCATNQQINSITQIRKEYNPIYIYYWLKGKKDFIFQQASVTRTPILNKSVFSGLEIALPERIEQDKVVAVLSSLDAKIELNKRINAELEAMAKTLYDYWFVQFDFPCPRDMALAQGKPELEGKPYKSSGGRMVWNAELKREIPEGWRNTSIESVIDKQPNSDKLQTSDYMVSGSIPIIDQSQDYICGYSNRETARIKPKQPHVVFGDHTRAVKLVNFEYARGADGTQILVPASPCIPGYLLFQIVESIDLSNYGYARHFKFLKESKTILPSKEIARMYCDIVHPFFKQSTENIFQNRDLAAIRDFLLPMLMNGQVEIS